MYIYTYLGYLPQEIFILAPSVKNINSPVRHLENKIKKLLDNIPIYVPTGDENFAIFICLSKARSACFTVYSE
jgi:hypothetical protein